MNQLIFTKDDAKQYDIPGGVCWLYPDSPTGRLSAALVHQDGRYPETGYRYNEMCTEAFFIISGKFTITIAGKAHVLPPNSVVYIPPRTPYAVEGTGDSFVFIEPKWNSGQNVATDLTHVPSPVGD